MTPELEFYFAVEDEVYSVLRELCDPATEVILTDVDVYEWTLRQGTELSAKQLYSSSATTVTGVCFRGEVGDWGYGILVAEFMQRNVSKQFLELHRDTFKDQLVFVVPQLTLGVIRQALISNNGVVTKALVFSFVIGLLAHERRHATQSSASLNTVDFKKINQTTVLDYFAQPHEFDAVCFNMAVQLGYTSMASVNEWQPTEEQQTEILQRLMQADTEAVQFSKMCDEITKTA